jgi:hypothetical protein
VSTSRPTSSGSSSAVPGPKSPSGGSGSCWGDVEIVTQAPLARLESSEEIVFPSVVWWCVHSGIARLTLHPIVPSSAAIFFTKSASVASLWHFQWYDQFTYPVFYHISSSLVSLSFFSLPSL